LKQTETASFAIGIATSVLWNLTDRAPSVSFTEDGTMSITKGFNTEKGLVIISVSATHNLTPENGYVYDNNILYAPNGTQIFPYIRIRICDEDTNIQRNDNNNNNY
jgi:hypothetical protein